MNQEFKVGQLLFNVRLYDDIQSRRQHLTCYIDAGFLDDDDTVRAANGTIVDFCTDGTWFESKNDAINALIRKLEENKDK